MKFNENLTHIDPHSEIKNEETLEAKYLHDFDSEESEANKITALSNFMPKMLPNDEIADRIGYLKLKQREVFNLVHTWATDYVKYDGHSVKLIHVFLSARGGTGKSHLIKVIYNTASKTWLDNSKDIEKLRIITSTYRNIGSKCSRNRHSFWS